MATLYPWRLTQPPIGSTYLLFNQPRSTRVAGPGWLLDGNPQFLLQIANRLGPTSRWTPLAQADGLVLDFRDHLDGDKNGAGLTENAPHLGTERLEIVEVMGVDIARRF